MSEKIIGVVGCGLMGSGIAQVCAQAGYQTVVSEVDEAILAKGLDRIRSFLEAGVERGKVSALLRDTTLSNLSGVTTLEKLSGCDLVIEAVVENIDTKREVFSTLDAIAGPGTLFASNTSSLCITEIAALTGRPDRFVGLHFFSPVPVMKLVEVIRGLATSDETYKQAELTNQAWDLWRTLTKRCR